MTIEKLFSVRVFIISFFLWVVPRRFGIMMRTNLSLSPGQAALISHFAFRRYQAGVCIFERLGDTTRLSRKMKESPVTRGKKATIMGTGPITTHYIYCRHLDRKGGVAQICAILAAHVVISTLLSTYGYSSDKRVCVCLLTDMRLVWGSVGGVKQQFTVPLQIYNVLYMALWLRLNSFCI